MGWGGVSNSVYIYLEGKYVGHNKRDYFEHSLLFFNASYHMF